VSTPPAVDIVIVNWNIGRPLRDCVAALAGARHQCYSLGQVIVVDNASSDGSATDLHAAGLPLSVIRNADNRGFAAACNQGAARCSADYLLFLNPDTTVLGETLAKTVACMARSESARIGIIGVQLLDRNGEIARSCARFPTTR
jgi:N-acetylglucosaminyl-diphospho-decaprenol L-rhamnosyltransferase